MLAGRQEEIHAERDRKLETGRQQRQGRRRNPHPSVGCYAANELRSGEGSGNAALSAEIEIYARLERMTYETREFSAMHRQCLRFRALRLLCRTSRIRSRQLNDNGEVQR